MLDDTGYRMQKDEKGFWRQLGFHEDTVQINDSAANGRSDLEASP